MRWLDVYVYPAIGDMQLDEVQPGDVLATIKARADTAWRKRSAPPGARFSEETCVNLTSLPLS